MVGPDSFDTLAPPASPPVNTQSPPYSSARPPIECPSSCATMWPACGLPPLDTATPPPPPPYLVVLTTSRVWTSRVARAEYCYALASLTQSRRSMFPHQK